MSRHPSSEKLADALLMQFAGPRAFIQRVETPAPEIPKPRSKYARGKTSIDDGLRSLCDTRRPGQTFSQTEIAAECHCHRRMVQLIERSALAKVARALCHNAPEIAEAALGNGVTIADVLRIHHRKSHRCGDSARRPSDFHLNRRYRHGLSPDEQASARAEANAGLPGLYAVASILSKREGRVAYGHKASPEQLVAIRAERMRRNKEGVCS